MSKSFWIIVMLFITLMTSGCAGSFLDGTELCNKGNFGCQCSDPAWCTPDGRKALSSSQIQRIEIHNRYSRGY